ncbi:SURF1 family protein [Marinobacter orientalis]|uniref:SURF1-like protein n=1 Tax=Marinobacter orientalis TaxID=1928859 RepID=A0A7Y0NK61_9GAMM|nr:SURF1 family protein [Marinobacter orientalis]NMT62827.1 SURF1 family protein [Marinobacter orientalis]TGX51505.1 SURF1 family protein [Marinobacter orientalis]
MSEPADQSRRKWHFDWRLALFAGLFLPLLTGLGVWQLERAQEKKAQLAQWQQEAGGLDWAEQQASGLEAGEPVTVSGRYGEASWLLDNRTRDGAPGYEVLTLFFPDEGLPVVVNRGWLQAPRSRDELPEISRPEGEVRLQGRLSEFPEPPVLKDVSRGNGDWPRRTQSLSHQQAKDVQDDVAGFVLRLSGPEQPGAYRADWAPDMMGPQTHYGYALQWFSLAAALVILTVVASYRKTGANDDNDNG